MSGFLPTTFFSKIEHVPSGCWNWTASRNEDGYGIFLYRGKPIGAHRCSWILHRGPIPTGKCVLHTCVGNRSCVNPEHLYVGTQKQNAEDRLKQNREPCRVGERNSNSTLTEERVRAVALLQGQASAATVATLHGVSKSAVESIWRGTAWKHLGVAIVDRKPFKPDRRGANSSHPKLNENDALQIKALKGAVPQIVLQERYNISQAVVSGIQTGKRWPHLFLSPLQP